MPPPKNSTASPVVRASSVLPWTFRFLLTTLEALCAFFGVCLVLTNPSFYCAATTRESVTTLDPATNFVFTQLGAGWIVIVFIEAVVMRLVDDIFVWRLLCIAILCSDALYAHSMAEAVGGWVAWVDFARWTVNDWAAAISTWPFIFTRIAIVFGFGYRKGKSE